MPEPKRHAGEKDSAYRKRLIEFYTKEGRPSKQAQAIGYGKVPDRRAAQRRPRKHK